MFKIKTNQSNTSSTNKLRIELESGFLLLFAFLYFLDDCGIIVALIPAVIFHEMGHVLTMLFFGARPTCLTAALSGFSIDYSGDLSETQELLTALSGPIFGLSIAVLFAKMGNLFESDYLLMNAGIGFVINAFNLLPAKPLDGGRVIYFILGKILGAKSAKIVSVIISYVFSLIVLLAGLHYILIGRGFALFFAGIWLIILQQNKTCKYY